MKCAEDDIREGRGQPDGCREVRDREIILAGLDGLQTKVSERAVCIESVKLLLRLDGRECCDDGVALVAVGELEAGDIVCDVAEQLSEEGDLEQLVEGDEF